ncbi:helicase HerA domain-containing protein [Halococcus salifodinae]|uniref:Helicase HerA central domain-containing protein n=1 Tax=Halococcus salifodinae DSM 8989 TaxID=1227456 RepID=M0MZK2_9EURY|nr:DUF87 domain-containing protein [Halococcus salifodinae]EMA50733.1 hypothetical protein C450_13692 [Halococcus salifodinae DSM 8989]
MSDNPLEDDPFETDDDRTDDTTGTDINDGTDATGTVDDSEEDSEQAGTVLSEQRVPNSATDLGSREMGHVLASETIHVSRDEYTVNAYVATERRDRVRVGDYVQIPYPDSEDVLFAVVDGLRYEPYTDLDDRSDTHNLINRESALDESEFVLVAELEPITILSVDGDAEDAGEQHKESSEALSRGIVNKVPKPNTGVELTEDEAYLREGLNIPHSGVFCGYLSVGGSAMEVNDEPFPYYLANPGIGLDGEIEPGEPAVFRHALVAGSTGKGKTHFAKNLLRQFMGEKRYPIENHETGELERSRLNVVVFDPENEYWQMREDGDLPDGARQRLERKGIEVGGVDDLEVFVPDVANTTAPATGQSRSFSIPFSLVRSRPELLMPYEPTPVTRGALEGCLSSYFEQEGGTPTYERFRNYLDANVDENSSLRQQHEIADGTWSAVMRRVKGGDGAFGDVFDGGGGGSTGANPLNEISGELFREGQVTVIPTGHLRGGKEELVVLSALSYVIENKISDHDVDSHVKDTPLLLSVDEAHNYLSGAKTLRGKYIIERAREAAKQGRKDKLGLLMITQNPEDIDDEVLKQTNTNVFLGLRDEVVEKVPSVPAEFKRDIPKFSKGQAVVKAPDVEAVEVIGLPYCVTKHGKHDN